MKRGAASSLPKAVLFALSLSLVLSRIPAQAVEPVAPFFEPEFPFVQTTVELAPQTQPKSSPRQVVVRGVLLTTGGFSILFDQELLRVAAMWRPPDGAPPITLLSMAQVSYAEPHRKAGHTLPSPSAPPFLLTGATPGIAVTPATLLSDPRPSPQTAEFGRGPLPPHLGRFEGIELVGNRARIHYRVGKTHIRESFEPSGNSVLRHLELSPHPSELHLTLAPQSLTPSPSAQDRVVAESAHLRIESPSPSVRFLSHPSGLSARIAPSPRVETITFSYTPRNLAASPQAPAHSESLASPLSDPTVRRWPQTLHTSAQLASAQRHGLACDSLALPLDNPWHRRIRPSDLAFLSEDRAAIVTYDGDVWILGGLAHDDLQTISWQRFASGLSEPLSIASVGGTLQVYTRNGLVRLHDRDGNGEADWYENFSDAWVQSASTRAFPLDMAMAKDGSTLLSQGGIGKGTPFAGAIFRISAAGLQTGILSTRAREPYLALHPGTGLLTSTDQQGNFIPSSVCYLVRPGADFGFGEEHPAKLTPPLVWIPHHEDNSCASQLWITGQSMGAFSGKLLHLSYGTGTPLLICPDLDAPIPQGAVIPLGLPTGLPLLHARMHPSEKTIFACGFQIYDSRTSLNWGIVRIRPSGDPITAPVHAVSSSDGVFLTFAEPLDPASIKQDNVLAATWNYLRSKQYGSGRLNRSGAPGIDAAPIGQVLLSSDQRTVFIHLPHLQPVMQLQVDHTFRFQNGAPAEGRVYFTIHQPHPRSLPAAGFPSADLSRSIPVTRLPTAEPPTKERGKQLSVSMGCVACHSTDGSTEGKTGPTWKGLFGKDRVFTDGSVESANEFYIRTSILEPEKKIVSGYHPGMASYKGILSEDQVDSIILYIRSLQ
ncbi:MAG: hypothetical protein RLZZ142_2230 [Verrucomicrobiota bacterium]